MYTCKEILKNLVLGDRIEPSWGTVTGVAPNWWKANTVAV